MSSVFTKIINGELPSYKVYEDDTAVAFLTLRPMKKGHVLVVPRKEVDNWNDLPEEDYTKLMLASKYVAQMIRARVQCKRVGVIIAGFQIPHAHIHLVPVDSEADFDFAKAYDATEEELKEMHHVLTCHD